MEKNEVSDLLDYIVNIYPNFKIDDSIMNTWFNELQQYDLDDVKGNLKSFMASEYYQKQPPTVSLLIKGLQRKYEKTDWNKVETLCQRCHKPLSLSEYDNHFSRCSNVDYVIRETKKYYHKELTRKELFAMSDEEFNERYNKLLHFIYDHTKNESEKTRIGFIFNPPSKEQAKNFLGGQQ